VAYGPEEIKKTPGLPGGRAVSTSRVLRYGLTTADLMVLEVTSVGVGPPSMAFAVVDTATATHKASKAQRISLRTLNSSLLHHAYQPITRPFPQGDVEDRFCTHGHVQCEGAGQQAIAHLPGDV
jgi:hypothetical protein